MKRFLPGFRETGAARQQAFFFVNLKRGDAGGAGNRVAGIGVAVEELDGVLRAGHHRVIDLAACKHSTHRDRAVGQALGRGDEIGHDAEVIGRERRSKASKAGDDFVEDQQDAVFVGDRTQALQIALRWQDNAGGTGHRLDDDSRNGFRAVQGDQTFQIFGKLDAMGREALAEGVALDVERVAHVIGRDLREDAAVVDEAADGDASEANAVIAFFAADDAGAGALPDGALIGDGDLQRRVDGFRTGTGEEHAIKLRARTTRGDLGKALGEIKCDLMAHLEGGGEIHGHQLTLDSLGDPLAAVACIHAPQTGGTIQHHITVDIGIIHAFGGSEQTGGRLELAVGRERHPEVIERRAVCFADLVHEVSPEW